MVRGVKNKKKDSDYQTYSRVRNDWEQGKKKKKKVKQASLRAKCKWGKNLTRQETSGGKI